ncbi:uncharacterized protein LOC121830204 isoform X1 [Peromyscus maniculatus bairdii]|uniref:uncharacterized protein LOC121830204 isoform X1 n=1 Tax=Peromyscus maniculatus bairdii TaxID=230844 RepID=UPI003FD389DD
MNWMEQHGTDGRGARRGRPGHAGSCSFPPSGAGTNSGKEGMRPSGSAYRSRAKPRVGWESWSGNLQEPAVCGKGAGVERRRPPGPAGPGPFSYAPQFRDLRDRGLGGQNLTWMAPPINLPCHLCVSICYTVQYLPSFAPSLHRKLLES